MKRKGVARFLTFTAIAAGAGVAIMASREEGRQKLAEFGSYLSGAWQFARDWVESLQQQEDVTYYAYKENAPAVPQNNANNQQQDEYTYTR